MRSLLVLIDGLGDEPIAAWQGHTPFEQAAHPCMDALAAAGTLTYLSICEDDLVPESCSCILRLLGVPREAIPANRAYLELLAHERSLAANEMVLRCNLAAVDAAGRLAAFNGKGLGADEMAAAAAACGQFCPEIEFIHLSDYRNLLLMRREEKLLHCPVAPPHESIGAAMDGLLAAIRHSSPLLASFLRQAELRLRPFAREGYSYALYPWGAASRQELPQFFALHRLHGAAVCRAEIVCGIARALGMAVLTPVGATGDVDTDMRAKAAAAVQLLQKEDFVLAHFNGSDEAAHRCDPAAKATFIAKIDSEFLAFLVQACREPLKLVICGDHVTSSLSGRHGRGELPVLAACLNAACPPPTIYSYRDILQFLYERE